MDELSISGTRGPCSQSALLRLQAGELVGEEAERLRAHAGACPRCGAALAALERDAARFRAEVSLERFAARVQAKVEERRRRRWAGPASLALAAGLAALVLAGPLLQATRGGEPHRLKGGSVLELFVGGAGGAPRLARDGEALQPGERVRVGYQAPGRSHVLVLSIDEAGVATALYPESGSSLPVEKGPGTHLMPDSLELTGRGRERVVALFSDVPIEVGTALRSASAEFARARRLESMRPLPLPAEESSLTVLKPEAREPR